MFYAGTACSQQRREHSVVQRALGQAHQTWVHRPGEHAEYSMRIAYRQGAIHPLPSVAFRQGSSGPTMGRGLLHQFTSPR